MKCRLWMTAWWEKMTIIASSSTEKATELKKTMVASSTVPMAMRFWRKPDTSARKARDWPLGGLSGALLYLLGVGAETLIVAAIYLLMPLRRMRLRHALIGGFTATVLWEICRHILIRYFASFSKASVVYGSLTTAVVALFGLEIAATLLLFGAQVISEYECLETPEA